LVRQHINVDAMIERFLSCRRKKKPGRYIGSRLSIYLNSSQEILRHHFRCSDILTLFNLDFMLKIIQQSIKK
jgi:hypothetical protein